MDIKKIINEEIINMNEGLEVWHGSDRKFDNFDMSKIGSGDGKSLGGWGIYFSTDKIVSDRYYTTNGFVRQHEIRSGKYFDLDESVSNDSNTIINGLKKLGIAENDIQEFETDFAENFDATNKQAYDWLSYVLGGEKQASLFLWKLGYLGNTFLDKWDRDARNYVVFDTSVILH